MLENCGDCVIMSLHDKRVIRMLGRFVLRLRRKMTRVFVRSYCFVMTEKNTEFPLPHNQHNRLIYSEVVALCSENETNDGNKLFIIMTACIEQFGWWQSINKRIISSKWIISTLCIEKFASSHGRDTRAANKFIHSGNFANPISIWIWTLIISCVFIAIRLVHSHQIITTIRKQLYLRLATLAICERLNPVHWLAHKKSLCFTCKLSHSVLDPWARIKPKTNDFLFPFVGFFAASLVFFVVLAVTRTVSVCG